MDAREFDTLALLIENRFGCGKKEEEAENWRNSQLAIHAATHMGVLAQSVAGSASE